MSSETGTQSGMTTHPKQPVSSQRKQCFFVNAILTTIRKILAEKRHIDITVLMLRVPGGRRTMIRSSVQVEQVKELSNRFLVHSVVALLCVPPTQGQSVVVAAVLRS